MRNAICVVQIAVLIFFFLPTDIFAETSDLDLGEGLLLFLVGIVTVPVSAGFIVVGLGELGKAPPDSKIASWGLGFGLSATFVGLKMLSADSDNTTLGIVATSIGGTCSILSGINLYRASTSTGISRNTLDVAPAFWINPERAPVAGIEVAKSF